MLKNKKIRAKIRNRKELDGYLLENKERINRNILGKLLTNREPKVDQKLLKEVLLDDEPEIAKYLIKFLKEKVDFETYRFAIATGDPELLKKLLRNQKANPKKITDKDGTTLLDIAKQYGRKRIIEFLENKSI